MQMIFVVVFQSMLNTYHSLCGKVFKTKQIRKFMVHVVIYYENSEIYKVQLIFKINYNTYLLMLLRILIVCYVNKLLLFKINVEPTPP